MTYTLGERIKKAIARIVVWGIALFFVFMFGSTAIARPQEFFGMLLGLAVVAGGICFLVWVFDNY